MRYKAAIFDLDGTLLYTIGDLNTAMNEMLREAGHPEVGRDTILASINNGAREFVRGCMPKEMQHDEPEVDRCFAIYKVCYARHYLDTTTAYDGVKDAVTALKAAGFKLGVFSNKQDEQTKALIAKIFGENTFDAVWGHAFLPHKPDPAGAYYIAGEFGVRPDEVAFIGDSNVDMNTAVNAGMFPIGVTWGYRGERVLLDNGAKKLIHSAPELIAFLTGGEPAANE